MLAAKGEKGDQIPALTDLPALNDPIILSGFPN